MALFRYNSVDWNDPLKGTGIRPYSPRPITPVDQWPWQEPNNEPLKRFTDYKEVRELVKSQAEEIEYLRKVVDGLLDIIKNMSEGD